jgi:RNA-directed DNA polymerase
VAQRVNDPEVLHGLKRMLHVAGKKGVAQGGVRSPLRSHLSLTAVERRLERAKEVTRRGPYTSLE